MDDLLSEFLTETSESISTLDVALVNLEQHPNDPQILGNIFRLVHTIKGTCGFLGMPRLEHVAHAGLIELISQATHTPQFTIVGQQATQDTSQSALLLQLASHGTHH